MNPSSIILRYGELFLKGRNRRFFERKLMDNLKDQLNLGKIYRLQGRLMVSYFQEHHSLRNVFGLVSYSPALRAGSDLPQIKEQALKILQSKTGTFKIDTKRSDKTFHFKSMELNRIVGEYIEENSNLVFKMEKPDHTLYIEINEKGIYLFTEIVPCCGGIPTGAEGKVLLLLENEASILAGILMMKRGAKIVPISVHGKKDLSLLQKYSPQELKLRQFNSMKEIENYATLKGINAFVRSNLFENVKEEESSLVIFKPLVSYSPEKIKTQLDLYKIKS